MKFLGTNTSAMTVLWWTLSVHSWRHVCTVPTFPSKQTSPPHHLPILLMQILLTPVIYTNHCPRPSVTANPMALVPASFPPCLPHPLKTPSSYPYPTACSVPHNPCLMLPWVSFPVLRRRCRSCQGQCFGSSCWGRAGWVATTKRTKLPPATLLAWSTFQMFRANTWGRMFIMWSDKNLGSRAESF